MTGSVLVQSHHAKLLYACTILYYRREKLYIKLQVYRQPSALQKACRIFGVVGSVISSKIDRDWEASGWIWVSVTYALWRTNDVHEQIKGNDVPRGIQVVAIDDKPGTFPRLRLPSAVVCSSYPQLVAPLWLRPISADVFSRRKQRIRGNAGCHTKTDLSSEWQCKVIGVDCNCVWKKKLYPWRSL